MSDHWDFYFCLVEGETASIFLDLGIASEAPISTHPHMACVRLAMRDPRADGLSSQQEFEALKAVEDDLTDTITKQCGAIYVGRNTSAGYRDFYFYASDPDRFTQAAEAATSRHAPYRCEVGTSPDSDWSAYFTFLIPTADDRQRMLNRELRVALEDRGDVLTEPRMIDHRAYFPTPDAASAYADQIKEMSFAAAPAGLMEEGGYAVDFERVDAPAEMDDVSPRLARLAGDLNGVYDGWGCTIVSTDQG
jgi:hypothetical protein